MKKTLSILILMAMVCALSAQTSGKTEWDEGLLKWKSNDGQFATRLDIRIYADYANFMQNDNDYRNGTMLRRARFGVKTKLWEDWSAEFDVDLADNEVDANDMWLRYDGLDNMFFKIGQFKIPFSLEELTSSRLITFLERNYSTLFAPGRRCALGYTAWGKFYHFSTAFYGQEFTTKEDGRVDEAEGFAARAALAPVNTDEMTLHLGGSFMRQSSIDSKGINDDYKSEAECKMGDTEIVDAGTINGIDYENAYGGEGAFSFRNLHLQGEYVAGLIERDSDLKDVNFSGGYAQLSWILTGERKPYLMDEGEFGKIIPKSNKLGAWEIAARYSYINLTDEDAYQNITAFNNNEKGIYGGKAANISLGLNWYPNPNIRFMLNYIMVDNSETANAAGSIEGDDDFSILSARFLVMY